jgi:hypothetical protein
MILENLSWPDVKKTKAANKLVFADGKFDRAGWNTFELPAEVD